MNLFLTSGQLQRFRVAACKVLRDVERLALGNVEIGEVASLPSGRTDVAHIIVDGFRVLHLANLDRGMPFLDGDRELVFWLFFHEISACFHTPNCPASVM